jgi:protein ImuB
MRRYLSVWLPRWPTDRLKARQRSPATGPFALVELAANTTRIHAANMVAQKMGVPVGITLADAMALVPTLITAPADPTGDHAALERLADWCGRYSPWVSVDGNDGLIMDVSGVPHLFGGERAMLDQMTQAFRRLQLSVRMAIADSPAAAWAWARYGDGGSLPSRPAAFEFLYGLPVKALRIDPGTAETLHGLGLKTIGDIAQRPRAPLVQRFGPHLLERLDRLTGRQDEPISPRQQPSPWRSRVTLAEPVSTRDAIDAVLADLLQGLCGLLDRERRGVRQLALHAYRVDGDVQSLQIGTSSPSRQPQHLARLFREPLDGLMPGFGFEVFILEAIRADPFDAEQAELTAQEATTGSGYAQLIDRLQGRLGARNVFRYEPVSRHTPEHAFSRLPPLARSNNPMPEIEARPTRLIQPENIDMDDSGEAFTWRRQRRRIARSIGPERIHGEWLHHGMEPVSRDYFQVEDETGRRYWLFRSQQSWFLHGFFA